MGYHAGRAVCRWVHRRCTATRSHVAFCRTHTPAYAWSWFAHPPYHHHLPTCILRTTPPGSWFCLLRTACLRTPTGSVHLVHFPSYNRQNGSLNRFTHSCLLPTTGLPALVAFAGPPAADFSSPFSNGVLPNNGCGCATSRGVTLLSA